jgi:molybdate transport system substrate-binding protein
MRIGTDAVAAMLLVGVGLAAPGHAQPAGEKTAAAVARSGTVVVFAAASLTSAFQAMAGAFEQGHMTVKVQLQFAGSPTLVQQIREGAPADVFAAADEANMQKLVESGEVAGAPTVFAGNALQIAVAPGNPKHIAGLADLGRSGLVIALCGPTVPCGRYAAEAFAKAHVVAPAASQELDVKAVTTKVAMGEADVGVVYVTDVRATGGKVEGVSIAESSNVVARYPIAVLKGAPNPAAGAELVAFVLSAEGQRILATFGFLPR